MMSNWPGRIFIGLLLILTLGYTYYSGSKWIRYATLTHRVPVTTVYWSMHSFDHDTFAAQADYEFRFNHILYKGRTLWDHGERYRNPWALEGPLETLSNQKWKVWFDPANPNHSSLQKKFPVKECVSTAILWLLMSYFIVLGMRGKTHANNNKE